jgi:hybrid polyketide synthase / nonribosomal peptide synthetase ACE1
VWQNTLVTRIQDQCQSVPDHVAIETATESLTYRELDRRINDVANILIRHGVRPGEKVVSLQRATATWIYTMLGIMKIGAVYVPVDPSLPLARMSVIVDECKPAIVFTNLPANELASVRDMGYPVLDVDSISSSEVNSKCVAEAEQPCAILYTSGTTGNPKGHILTHRSILNNIAGTIAMLGTEPLHVLQQSALTFDMAIWQPLLGLASGGSVSVVPQEARRDSAKISEIISKDKVSTIVATPLEYASWIQVGSEDLRQATKWKHALTGGEALSHAVLQKFRSLDLPELRVFNSYGPAEISFYATAIEIDYRASDLPSRISIGMPMPNYSVYVVDEKLRPVPIGWPGEIVIGGLGVGQGYLNRPEMTATAFIPDTLASPEQKQHGFTTLFRSGDRGRLRADGALLFDGRLDGSTQIKLRGMRIELQDIEASILAASSGQLSQAIVTTRGDGASKFLVAYVVFASSSPTSSDQEAISRTTYLRGLRNSLALPTYMRPATLIEIASLPVGRHSKVDRAALAALPLPTTSAITSQSRDTSALTAAEHALWQLWCDVLPEEALTEITPGPDTDFIEIGGNSILIVQLHAAMQSDLMGGKRMPLVQLFENTGLADMSECVRLHMEAS